MTDSWAEYEAQAAALTGPETLAVLGADLAVTVDADPRCDTLDRPGLSAMIRAWRDEIDSTPLPTLISVDEAVALIARHRCSA